MLKQTHFFLALDEAKVGNAKKSLRRPLCLESVLLQTAQWKPALLQQGTACRRWL